MNANQVTFAGFSTAPATFKMIGTRGLCEFTIASNRKARTPQEQPQVDFLDVKVWGKNAEAISREVGKGSPLIVTGPLRLDRWEKDGEKHSRITMEAYIVGRQILAPKAEAE